MAGANAIHQCCLPNRHPTPCFACVSINDRVMSFLGLSRKTKKIVHCQGALRLSPGSRQGCGCEARHAGRRAALSPNRPRPLGGSKGPMEPWLSLTELRRPRSRRRLECASDPTGPVEVVAIGVPATRVAPCGGLLIRRAQQAGQIFFAASNFFSIWIIFCSV